MSKNYSHVSNFTDYMKIVVEYLKNKPPQKILDIPAGNGIMAEFLRKSGHAVTCADINEEKKDYVFADMKEKLPFDDEIFDVVICLEGIEHLLEPSEFIAELCRVCKNKGEIIISLPNIQNMYSRFMFLCTGTFYQFLPLLPFPETRNVKKDNKSDLGHISSLSYIQLKYLFAYHGAKLLILSGDRYKRILLLPFFLPFVLMGYLFFCFKQMEKDFILKSSYFDKDKKHLFSLPLLFSRSLILFFEKGD